MDLNNTLRDKVEEYLTRYRHVDRHFMIQISVFTNHNGEWILHCPFLYTYDKNMCMEKICNTDKLKETSGDLTFKSYNMSYENQIFDIDDIEYYYKNNLNENQIRVKNLYPDFVIKPFSGKVKTS